MADPDEPLQDQPKWLTRLLLTSVGISAVAFWSGLIWSVATAFG